MGKRENKVETYLKSRVEEVGGTSRKWVSPGVDGVPDQIVILPWRLIFVEVKTSDGELAGYQEREHNRLRESGAIVTTVYGELGVDKFIDDVQNRSVIEVEYR